jgi:Xaa-Pro aminopeptidase
MTDAPKLLTEAEAREIHALAAGMCEIEGFVDSLRERGLIAPEPVDPLLIEAREVCAKHFEAQGLFACTKDYRDGKNDNEIDDMEHEMSIALAALKRGMELANPTLTQGQVLDAYYAAHTLWAARDNKFQHFAEALHAALTGAKP